MVIPSTIDSIDGTASAGAGVADAIILVMVVESQILV